jgi:hypothetical protein
MDKKMTHMGGINPALIYTVNASKVNGDSWTEKVWLHDDVMFIYLKGVLKIELNH